MLSALAAEPAPPRAESKPLDYVIVVTGGELLAGAYPDSHTHFLTRTLRPLGCRCVGSLSVDDHREDIIRAVRYATNQAQVVIVTGGLGPTPNDLTRETLAEFTGIPLHEDAEALAEMERRFNTPRDQLRPNLRRQTLVPTRGGYLKNTAGTAVGLVFDSPGALTIALPGPPKELQPMVRNELVPFLRRRFGVRDFGCTLTLRFVGVGQSQIDQTIKDHVALAPDVTVTSLFEGSRVDFTFSVPGNTPADRARLQQLGENIREHLGDYYYADDGSTLEDVVVRALRARDGSLTLVEVGSGGHLAAALGGGTGIDRLLAGAFTAPTEEAMTKLIPLPVEHAGATGVEKVKAWATGAAPSALSQWAIAVGPVESEPGGARAVWLVVRFPEGRWETQRVTVQGAGELAHANLTTQILDHLRRWLK
jgi:nicotinamide-nucleotide amidase